MQTYQEINANELATLLNEKQLTLVDVRNDDEVRHGYIQGATHIPLAALPNAYAPLLKAETLVFYCHSGACCRYHSSGTTQSAGHKRSR